MEQLAVYIHWPYCARICPYCDFNVYKRRGDDALVPAILQDLAFWRELSGPRQISSIHFGGGTPSLMTPKQINAVIQHVENLWGIGNIEKDDIEIALEANPLEMNESDWRGYRAAGLTRMSLGVQSFDDGALKFLGRDHDGETARAAVDLAMEIFPSVSADLIFGWDGQTIEQLKRDVDGFLLAGVPHLSTYQLTIEEGTAFAKAEMRGQNRAVSSDVSADFYDVVCGRLRAAGFEHYEVSNFAKPGHCSRHNLAYWRGIDYVGVGPGAHGRLTRGGNRAATIAHLTPRDYTESVVKTGAGIDVLEALSGPDWAAEYLLMGLRIDEGISLDRYRELSGQNLGGSDLEHLISDGLVIGDGDQIRASLDGRLVLNAITEKLLLK